ncbi:MAG: hypothetical protein IPK82_07340 [Polyangiaceae bacterium]|nr:hypothetical protein [Polyangiaceae bacterium]
MKPSKIARVLLGTVVLGSLMFTACKKDEEPATVPVPTASQAATDTPPPPPPSDDAGAPDPSATAPSPPPVATGTGTGTSTGRKGDSIDACCNALRAIQKSGKTAAAKAKAASAAAVCPGVAKLVKDGTTSRSAGLAQIRSAMSGFDVPGECR